MATMFADEYSDPYEAKKQKAPTRPGAAPPAPTNFPAAPPSPAGPYNPGTAAPAPQPAGGLTIQQLQQTNANASEDFGRFQQGDIDRWSPYYDQASGKFRSSRGAPGLFDKPTECPPGQGPSGPDENDPCTTKGYSDSSGGPGGGGGNAGVGPVGGGDPSGLGSMMETNLKKMLAGGESRYSPSAMQGLLAQIKQRIESSKRTQLRQSGEDAASRGMSRSGAAAGREAGIRRGAEAEFTGEYANVLKAKIDADQKDKLDALDRSQRYLDSMRDELYRRDMSAIQRQQFQANLDLAYANLANQRQTLASTQQHQRDMLGAQYGYQATFGGL